MVHRSATLCMISGTTSHTATKKYQSIIVYARSIPLRWNVGGYQRSYISGSQQITVLDISRCVGM